MKINMEHTNEIAINILKEEYADYPRNDWHYNREYNMLVKTIEQVKNCHIANVVGQSEQLKADEEPIVKGEQYVADYIKENGKDLTSL